MYFSEDDVREMQRREREDDERAYAAKASRDYDVEEMGVLTRMKHVMKTKHGYTDADFEGATFMDIESMFLDDCGERDFRS
jgi:hypothetical protein